MKATIIGVVLGWALSSVSAWGAFCFARRRELRDVFAADVASVRRELADRADNLDEKFVAWHSASVRRLAYHADYFRDTQPRWWRGVEQAWTEYELPQHHQLDYFIAKHITRDGLIDRLNRLHHVIRAA